MPTPTIDFNSGLSFAGAQRVYTRKRWADSWTLDDRLHCTQATWTAQPSIPTAQLVYAYGPALERNAETKSIRPKLELGGWFVKIEFDCEDGVRKWYGYVDDDADNQGGTIVDTALSPSSPIPGGMQTFSCVGIIMALAHAPVIETEFTIQNMSLTVFSSGSETVRARSGPKFNTISINNEPIKDRDGTRFFWRGIYGFNDSSSTIDAGGVKVWSTADICEYLMTKCEPLDEAGAIKIPIDFDSSKSNLPTHDAPAIDTDGMTLLQVFDRLINSSRSIGYLAYVDEGTNSVKLKVFTTTKTAILDAASATLIPANPDQINILALADQATAVSVQRNQSQFANQLVVRGAKRVVVCTLPMELSISTAFGHRFVPFQEAWTNADQTALDAELTAIDAMGLDPYITADKKNEVINSPRYHHIGRYYRFRHNWRWAIGTLTSVPALNFTGANDISIFVKDAVYPPPEPDTSLDEVGQRYWPFPRNLRILPHLPFKVGFDYSDAATPDTDFDEVNLTTSVKAYRKLFVFGQQLKGDLTYEADKFWDWSTQHTRKYQLSLNQPSFSIEAEPMPEYAGWGLALNVQGAPQSHLIYRVGDDALLPFDYHIPKIDVKSLAVTLAFEEDRYAEAVFPKIVPWTASKQVAVGLIVTTSTNTYTVTQAGTFSATSPTHTTGEVLNGTAKLTWISGRDAMRVRVIDLGESFKRITILPGTVTEIANDGTVKKSMTKYHLRNAVPMLEKIVKQMAQWYLVPRAVMRLTSSRASAAVDVGKFVDTLNPGTAHEAALNTVVTEVTISSQPGNGQSPPVLGYSVATAFGELDPLVWVPRKIPVNAPKPASGGMQQGTF